MTKRKPPLEHRVQVVMKAPRRPPDLAIYAQVVHDQMTENAATFPAPDPPLPSLQAVIDALKQALSDASTRADGTAAVLKRAAGNVMDALNGERAYVEKVARGDPEHAALIASRAAMYVFGRPFRHKPPLALENGPMSGSICATAAAIKNAASYEWLVSTDDCVTWATRPTTTRADTTIPGLEPGTNVWVKCRALLHGSIHTDRCDPSSSDTEPKRSTWAPATSSPRTTSCVTRESRSANAITCTAIRALREERDDVGGTSCGSKSPAARAT